MSATEGGASRLKGLVTTRLERRRARRLAAGLLQRSRAQREQQVEHEQISRAGLGGQA